MSDQDRISPYIINTEKGYEPWYNINQIRNEDKEKYQFGDNVFIQYLILWTNIIRIVWLTVRRVTNLIWELKG